MSAYKPLEELSRRSLPLEIHAATRDQHTSLNRLITSRLHLCLQPYANNPHLYTVGIAALGQIYVGFENASKDLETSDGDRDVRRLLSNLAIPGLGRIRRLNNDLRTLGNRQLSTSEPAINAQEWQRRVKQNVLSKPHVILAYQWVMYMALFNGGRWIRSQLVAAGPAFWGCTSTANGRNSDHEIDCLTFWQFPGSHDGDDLKDDFKTRFNATASQLDDWQRKEIVEESVRVFELCLEIVLWLDAAVVSRPDLRWRWASLPSWLILRLMVVFGILASAWQRLSTCFALRRRPAYPLLVRQNSHSD